MRSLRVWKCALALATLAVLTAAVSQAISLNETSPAFGTNVTLGSDLGGNPCPDNLPQCRVCDKNKQCESCHGPLWGATCGSDCPEHCYNLKHDGCAHETGLCHKGCSYGFWGPKCEGQCPEHCYNVRHEGCAVETGKCKKGCSKGFHGDFCDIEETCAKPTGTDCSFYDDCLQANVDCELTRNVAKPKCKEFEALEPQLSGPGVGWSKHVRKCLQEVISQNVLQKAGKKFECSAVEESFFRDHLPCYLDGDVSFCDLALSDQTSVYKNAMGVFFSRHIWEASKAGAKLTGTCGSKYFQSGVRRVGTAIDNVRDKIRAALSVKILEKFGWNGTLRPGTPDDVSPVAAVDALMGGGGAEADKLDFVLGFQKSSPEIERELEPEETRLFLAELVQEVTEGRYEVYIFNGEPSPSRSDIEFVASA